MSESPRPVTVGVVGAGAMGSGIAQVAAAAGHRVVLADANTDAVARARSNLGGALDKLVNKQKLDRATRDEILARIEFTATSLGTDVSRFRECGLVIEAIAEDLRVKQALFGALSNVVAHDAVLASNTSSLSIASIASACERRERVIGVHFFNPAPILPLVEIVPWLGTDESVTTSTRALIDAWGKTTVHAADTPGFIVNRVARPFYSEALRIHDEGVADCATIDWAMKELGAFRMGPFELMDFIGNDVNFTVTSTMFAAHFGEPRYRPSHTQKQLVEAGYLGRKSGRGFYRYDDGSSPPTPHHDPRLGTLIFERILAMLINEAAEAVFYRVASAHDIDLAMTKGVNYPKGLLAWSDLLGSSWAFDRLTRLQEEYAEDRYRPSALLRRIARDGGRFHP